MLVTLSYYYYSADNLPVFVTLFPVDAPLVDCDDVSAAREVVVLLVVIVVDIHYN